MSVSTAVCAARNFGKVVPHLSPCLSSFHAAVPPLFVVEFLHRIMDIFTEYFSECSEHRIKDNYVVVYEVGGALGGSLRTGLFIFCSSCFILFILSLSLSLSLLSPAVGGNA